MNGTILSDVACAVVGAGAGVWGGFRLGVRYGSPAWRYWLINGGALVVCLSACALGLALGARWFAVLALGVLAGSLTGLKYGIRGGFVLHPGAPAAPVAEDDVGAVEAGGADAVQAAVVEAAETGDAQG